MSHEIEFLPDTYIVTLFCFFFLDGNSHLACLQLARCSSLIKTNYSLASLGHLLAV